MNGDGDHPLIWLAGEIKTPPFTSAARVEAGVLLRRLQRGETPGLPHSRPMPGIGRRCHELRINDQRSTWRIIYRLDPEGIVIGEVFMKKTQATPKHVIVACQRRFQAYDQTRS
jgi:phage-related protein